MGSLPIMVRLVSVFFAGILVGFGAGADLDSAVSDPVRDQYVEVRLISDLSTVAPGSVLRVGIEYRMDPDWHIYWRNPGESGLPPEHTWELPEGVTVGPILWPPPERYEVDGMVTYVYHDRVLLVQELRLPESLEVGGDLDLKVTSDWLMCSVPCIPGQAVLRLRLPIGPESIPDSANANAIDTVAKTWPKPPGAGSEVWATWIDEEQFRLGLGGPDLGDFREVGGIEIFPLGAFRVDRAPAGTNGADGYAFTGTFYPYASEDRDTVDLVLVGRTGDGAESVRQIEVQVPIGIGTVAGGGESGDVPGLSILVVLAAFFGGMILNVMPCVFPVLGLKVLHLTSRVGENRGELFRHGGAYTLGVLVSFWILAGVLLLLRSRMDLTWGFQLQEPGFLFVLAWVLLLFAMNLSGVFEIGGSLVGVGQKQTGRDGLGGSFFSGVLATTVSTPCSAPILGTALSAAFVLSPGAVWLIFTLMGLGLAAPFVLLSLVPALQRWLPRPGEWMETFKQALAFPLYATVVWLVWSLAGQVDEGTLLVVGIAIVGVALAGWIYGRFGAPVRSRATRRKGYLAAGVVLAASVLWGWPAGGSGGLEWETWSPERVSELRAEGRPVYVDFTARWCLTCKVNKARVFGSEAVLERFRERDVALLKADLTDENPEASRVIESFGRGAVPMNLIYLPGQESAVLLPELIGPGDVLAVFE